MPSELVAVRASLPGTELLIPFETLVNFGLALCRMSGILTFLPIPGLRMGLDPQRLVLAALFSIVLLPWMPPADGRLVTLSSMAAVAASEAALGIGLGLCVALMQEGIQLAAQMIGLQAGFSYASTIDPTSNADSAILQVLLTLASSLLFLAYGFDTVLFRFVLTGMQSVPPGQWSITPDHIATVMALFPHLFYDAIRCALPVLAILLVIDSALALLSRIQPQLQLLTLSFPLKMLAAIVIVAQGAPMLPTAAERAAMRSLESAQKLMQRLPR